MYKIYSGKKLLSLKKDVQHISRNLDNRILMFEDRKFEIEFISWEKNNNKLN